VRRWRALANAVSEFHQAHSNKKQSKFSGRSEISICSFARNVFTRKSSAQLDSLDSAYDSIRNAAEVLGGLEIRVERGGLVAPRIGDAHLPDAREKCRRWRSTWQRAGIHALSFSKKFHVGELDTLARLAKASLLRSEDQRTVRAMPGGRATSGEPAWKHFYQYAIGAQGGPSAGKSHCALVAYGGHSPREKADAPIQAA